MIPQARASLPGPKEVCLARSQGTRSEAWCEPRGPGRDQFGGWRGKTFEATGFFRLERDGNRHWLATPDGSAFVIHGIDHVGLFVASQDYNRAHWENYLGLSKASGQRARLEAFYRKKVAADRRYLGFNCHYSHRAPVGMDVCPYIPRTQTLEVEYWRTWHDGWREENFLDVFADHFVSSCERSARRMVDEGRVGDPWVLAHALTDSPVLVPEEARPFRAGFYHKPLPGTTTWSVRVRNLGEQAAGKRAYVGLMRRRYGDIDGFNASYNTAFGSRDALAATRNWRLRADTRGNIAEERDNHAFLLQILEKAWSTQVRVIKAHDPNHLVFGDTLNLNSPLPDDVIELYAKHFPVVVYQYYGATWEDHRAVMDRLRRLTNGMPVFSADSSWSVRDPTRMPDTLGPQCASYHIAAEKMWQVYSSAFARPDFLGWSWCGWMDRWESSEPFMQHAGLQDAFGEWHQPLADRFSEFGKEMYSRAARGA